MLLDERAQREVNGRYLFVRRVDMETFDLIVVGSGAGTHVASIASKEGLDVALIDEGPVGGVCLNSGCTPSKMLIYPADVIRILQNAKDIGVDAGIVGIDFRKIMNRMRRVVERNREDLEKAIKAKENITLYQNRAKFVKDYTIRVDERILTAPKIVIATGARAFVPTIQGLNEAGYIDNDTLLNLEEPPESLIIIGGGLVACEYGHFFSAIGTNVTILGRNSRILKNEDPEVSQIIGNALSEHISVHTNHEVVRINLKDGMKVVSARNLLDNKVYNFRSDEVLLAAGRRSNSDLLRPDLTGVMTDLHGWVIVDKYLETTKKEIWAIGDAIGKHMFRHTAKYESDVLINNVLRAEGKEDRQEVDFHSVPHAVFTYPQVAGVGLTESEAIGAGHKVQVGRARYVDVVKGTAMAEVRGFVKIVVEADTGKILGCSVVGSEASELVQQVVYLMNSDSRGTEILRESQIIHPTLNEILGYALFDSNTIYLD